MQTLQQLLFFCSQKHKDHVAFQIRQEKIWRKITFSEVIPLVEKVQSSLVKLGVGPGDRVVILSENRPEWAISYLAVCAMGAVAVPLDAMLKREDIFVFIEDCQAKAIILSAKYVDLVKATTFESLTLVMEAFNQLEAKEIPQFNVNPADLAAIVYTSGTTGNAKGVMLSHKNIMSNVLAVGKLFPLGPGDNFLSVLPLHHTFETTCGFLGAFSLGCSITYTESLKSYVLIRNMQETGVTVMCGVPLLYQLIYDGIMREVDDKGMGKMFAVLLFISKVSKFLIGINIGKILFAAIHKKFGGKIRFFVTGGAAIDPQLIRNFELLGFAIVQGYGLTESSPILTCCTLKKNKIGSVGRAIQDVKIKIAGSEPVGEILASGPNIMQGYYKRLDLSNEVLKHGWLYTGDVGYLDEEGYLFITGRNKDVIVTGAGVNVYPEELEPLLGRCPEIKEACIIGTKQNALGRRGNEQVAAIIVAKSADLENSIRLFIEGLNKTLPEYKRIAKVVFRQEELPKTRLLKVKKYLLRKEIEVNEQ
ncbi:MAG: AMP-binding protein [Candidatus Margulisiibacteriota bacterium]